MAMSPKQGLEAKIDWLSVIVWFWLWG